MIGLDRIIKISGVVAAGQFDADGNVIRSVCNLPDEIMKLTAQWCARNTTSLQEHVLTFSEKSGMEWAPLTGWAVWGGKYTFFVVNNTGIIIETKRADFNQLRVDLLSPGPTGGNPLLSGL